MGQSSFEKDRNRFSLSERLVVELFLLTYLFVFLLADPKSIMPYIWLLLAIVAGVLSYLLFYSRDYSFGLGIGFSLGVMVPLLLMGAPLMLIVVSFVFVLWRTEANFNGSRINGWPFFAFNTAALIIFSLFTRLFFVFENPQQLMKQLLIIYLITSFLFYFIRMMTIAVNSRQLRNFKVVEAGRVLGIILGLGVSVFLIVLFALKPVRLLFIKTFGFLFGGIFTLFGKAMEPIIEYFKSGSERFIEENLEELESIPDPEMQDELTTFGATSSIFEYSTLAIALAVLIAVVIILIRKKKNGRLGEKQEAYSFSFKGKKENETNQQSMLYDYSSARDEVRKSFEQFEKEAQTFKFNRLHGETVKEWFQRMGWEQNDNILSTYNDVRYGSRVPSESEHNLFIQSLERIKESFFKKDV